MDNSDIRDEPCIIITDTYTREGQHVSTIAKTQDGRVVWKDGPTPAKDCVFFWPTGADNGQ
jgi:hypothetical protein